MRSRDADLKMQWLRRRSLCRPLVAPSDRPEAAAHWEQARPSDQTDERERGEGRRARAEKRRRSAAATALDDESRERQTNSKGATLAQLQLRRGPLRALRPVPSGRSLTPLFAPLSVPLPPSATSAISHALRCTSHRTHDHLFTCPPASRAALRRLGCTCQLFARSAHSPQPPTAPETRL